jgi:hypothetical protein
MEGASYLEDGRLTDFKRSGVYYARIRISPMKYIWRSLKTSTSRALWLGRRLLFQIESRPRPSAEIQIIRSRHR